MTARDFEYLKSSLVSLISHELRTPLSYISGSLEMVEIALDEPSMQTEIKSFLGIIDQGVKQLNAIIDDLLLFSSLEKTPKKRLVPQIQEGVDVKALVYDLVNALKPTIQGKKQKVRIECTEGLPTLNTDRGKLFEILMQILSNAIKFTPQQGEILLRVASEHEHVTISVTDTGPGIASDVRNQIFDPFFQQEEHLTREHGGLGLGLTLAQRLCHTLGGEIQVSDNGSQGSCFTVVMPIVNPIHEKKQEMDKLRREVKALAQSREKQEKHIHELRTQLWKYAEDLKMASKTAEQKQKELDNVYVDMMRGFAAALEARDPFTRGRSTRVAAYARLLAEALVLSEADKDCLEKGCLLYDLGYIGIPDDILHKDQSNPLSDEERNLIQMHPLIGVNMLGDIRTFEAVVPIILHHHENWDGSGYPDGLSQESIPFLARVVHLVDAFDAMISDRAYRPCYTPEYAVTEIKKHAGTHFDPDLVKLFTKLWETGDLQAVIFAP